MSLQNFYVHLNSVNFVYTTPNPNVYRLLPVGASAAGIRFSQGAHWSASKLTVPRADCSVLLMNQVLVSAGAANPVCNWVTRWWKNYTVDVNGFLLTGTGVGTGLGVLSDLGAGSCQMQSHTIDIPEAGDFYSCFVFIDSAGGLGNPVTIDGNPDHTFACGFISYNNYLYDQQRLYV